MKANLKKMLGLAALGISLLTNSGPTWAGLNILPEVTVSTTWASGSLTAARYSTDATQYIGCNPTMTTTGPWTACYAVDKNGQSFVCGSGNYSWFSAATTMTDSSFLYFHGSSNGGDCDTISINDGSLFLK